LRDWIDVVGELSYKEQRRFMRDLGDHLMHLADVGLFVGTRDRHMLMVGGVSSEASSWRGIEIEFQPVEGAQFADAEGKPIVSVEDAFSRLGRADAPS
jgi:hypothetical protein